MNLAKISAIALSAVATVPSFAEETAPAAPKGPFEQAKRNREYVAKYSGSIAVVRYWTKKNANDDEPKLRVPYKCPNCNNTHYRDGGESSEKGIPAEFAGFVLAPDRVLVSDVMIEPEFIDHIDIECAGETVPAVEFEASPKHGALVLKTERSFANAKPIQFGGAATENPVYFFIVREKGGTMAGFSASNIAKFRHHVELDKDIYEGNPNTLVLDAKGDAVTVAFQELVEIGQESFAPPSSWEMEPAARRFERLAALEERFRKAVFPVYLQLEAKGKDESGRLSLRWSGSEEVKNDVDSLGIAVEGGKVIIPAKLAPSDTARLVKIEATLPDGSRTALEFAGSYAGEGAFEARFAGESPESVCPLMLDGREPIRLWNHRLAFMSVANRGGRLVIRRGTCEVGDYERERGNVVVAEFEQKSGLFSSSSDGWRDFVVADDGKLVAVKLDSRHGGRWGGDDGFVQGARLAALASTPRFDPENIPRGTEDRRRTPWLGVEVQAAGADIVRGKKATAYIKRHVELAPLVTEVAPGSPADRLGIKAGDILVSAKHPDGSKEESFSLDQDLFSSINWNEAFEDDRFIEFGSLGEITPWPDAEGGVNGTLAEFGVGTEVVVAWVSDGVRKEGKVSLDLAPVHFRNAPRSRNKELGMTVCDMTYEVRKYFKLDADASGVVVAKIKGGGVAAVAGVRPLELVVEVNGEGVKSAKDFLEKTKGRKDLSFTVRRLTATRIVPIKL